MAIPTQDEKSDKRHAEYVLLEKKLKGKDLSGCTLVTTLEPCVNTSQPCCALIRDRKIARVFIGLYDPNPAVHRQGWQFLDRPGCELRDFTPLLREELATLNSSFLKKFRESQVGATSALFDFTQNGGRYDISPSIKTKWTRCGDDSIYAVDYGHNVALAQYADQFDKIDDPSAYEFAHHCVRATLNQILIFRCENHSSYALVQIMGVHDSTRDPSRGSFLKIRWQLRP